MTKKIIHFINGIKIVEFSNTNIYIIENMIDESLCNSIIDSINESLLENIPIKKGQNVECYKVIELKTKGLDGVLCKIIVNIIEIIKIICPKITISSCSPYELRKVYGETKLHIDGVFGNTETKTDIRSITIVAGLNDEYNGGVYSFPEYDIQFKLKKGSVVFFPPFWTHSHNVSSIDKGQYRYIFSTWGLE
jgi:hypothetical protein